MQKVAFSRLALKAACRSVWEESYHEGALANLGLDVQPQYHSLCQEIYHSKYGLPSSNIATPCDPVQKGKDVHKACRVDQRPGLPLKLCVVPFPLQTQNAVVNNSPESPLAACPQHPLRKAGS